MAKTKSAVVFWACLLCWAVPASAIILDPNAPLPVSKPADTFVGRWNANASCVLVGPDMVITTRHQGGGVGSTVQIGGVNYTVSNVWYDVEPNVPDLQVAELAGANFKQYAQINTVTTEAAWKGTVVLGGYGMGRGATLYYKNDPNIPFGYTWDGSGNTTQRWGETKISGYAYGPGTGMYTNLISAYFYGPQITTVPDEAAVAEYDSGGGWFRNISGVWYVAGLSYSTDHVDSLATWWDDPNAVGTNPDKSYAVQVSAYATWIKGVLAPITTNCTASSANWADANAWSAGAPTPHANTNITNGGSVTINQAGDACPTLTLGVSAGQSGSANMTGGVLNCLTVYVGNAGTGTFTQSGGDHSIDGNLYLGFASGAGGSYTLSDGNLTVGLREYVGYSGTGSFAQNGGRHTVGSQLYVGSSDGNGTYVLSGGQLIAPLASVGARGTLALSGGTMIGNSADSSVLPGVTNAGLVHVTSGSYSLAYLLTPDPNVLQGSVQVDAHATMNSGLIVQSQATVAGTLRLQGSSTKTASVVNTLAIAGPANALTGKVDIGNNYLVITAPGQLAAVNGMVANATNFNHSPAYGWDGNGITSSNAAADSTGTLSIGVGNADDEGLTGTLFGSHIAAATDTLVMLTITGDADLNGVVNVDDYNTLRGYYGVTNATWEMADFNYDGVVDATDYNILRGYYNQSLPAAPDMLMSAADAVPEPVTLAVLAIGGLGLLLRRRRSA
jgi:hypothetical protein